MNSQRPIAAAINTNYLGDEEKIVTALTDQARFSTDQQKRIQTQARQLVQNVRANPTERGGLDAFLTKADAAELSQRAKLLKKQIAKKLAEQPAA